MDLPLLPGREVKVTIRAFAAHSGDIDFCINSAISCVAYPVRTIIR